MSVAEINPCTDRRWSDLVNRHPSGSVFHTPEWLEALHRTYGYKPSVLTTNPGGSSLANGLVFCRVESWLTGRRLVSLPFSDYCHPIADSDEETTLLFAGLEELARTELCDYLEVRPVLQVAGGFRAAPPSQTFLLNRIDLRQGSNQVFRRFHRNCIQRRIRHAESQGLTVTASNDPKSLDHFYHLVLETRRRQRLLPQPIEWFRNLIASMSDRVTIRLAWQSQRLVAGIMTLRFGNTMYYKYGGSVAELHKLAGMPYLLWTAIQDACRAGLDTFDLGRSDLSNDGLVTFKGRWGSESSILKYYRWPSSNRKPFSEEDWSTRLIGSVCRYLSDTSLSLAGQIVYRHIG